MFFYESLFKTLVLYKSIFNFVVNHKFFRILLMPIHLPLVSMNHCFVFIEFQDQKPARTGRAAPGYGAPAGSRRLPVPPAPRQVPVYAYPGDPPAGRPT